MDHFRILAVLSLVVLAACQPQYLPPTAPPVPVAAPQIGGPYQISPQEAAQIPIRIQQEVNLLRSNVGAPPLMLDPQLAAAGLAHSRDMAAQNRAWHWGSDGSSPIERARRAGFTGELVGENISESYENDIQTLSAWMATRDTRDVIMDPAATRMGLAWYQEPSGKIWWTLLTGK